jgi:hypothetical protein
MVLPGSLDDLLEDRDRHLAAGLAAAEGAALPIRIVVARPDHDRDLVGETRKPDVVLVVRGAGLARDVRSELADALRRAAFQNPLQDGLELEEGRLVSRAHLDRGGGLAAVYGAARLFHGLDGIGRGPRSLIGDGRVERREVDEADRLCAEDEGVVTHALDVELRLEGEFADAIEALLRLVRDATLEETRGDEVLGAFERPAQRHETAPAAVVVLGRPVVLRPGERPRAADRR